MTQPEGWAALLTLTALEIVLGIDNIVFISILAGKLPEHQQPRARTIGLVFAMLTRIVLLLSITWIMRLTEPLFEVLGQQISGRDLILVLGGLFLLAKSTHEIHDSLEGSERSASVRGANSLVGVIVQIGLLDIVFSLDSVITAVGMARHVSIMVAAIVHRHPTVKMLALSFLVLIGVTLIAEGFGQHISKGYIYFAMAFSVFVEMLNLRLRKVKTRPVELRSSYRRGVE